MGVFSGVLIGVLGAAGGAYFGVHKTKVEKLWLERYRLLSAALEKSSLLCSYCAYESDALLGIGSITKSERKEKTTDWVSVRHALDQDITMLKMLFSRQEFRGVDAAWVELDESVYYLTQSLGTDQHDNALIDTYEKTKSFSALLVKIGRDSCVPSLSDIFRRARLSLYRVCPSQD